MKFNYGDQFNHWVEWTRQNLPAAGNIPSIAASFSDFGAPWLLADRTYDPALFAEVAEVGYPLDRFLTLDTVSPLGEADEQRFARSFEQLTAHPGDLLSRFTVLHLFYNLPAALRDEEEATYGSSYDDVDELDVRENLERAARKRIGKFKADLALLVRHLDVDQVQPDWRIVRWEILNSYAIGDLDRALRLYNRAYDLKLFDLGELSIMRGQFRYLAIFGSNWDMPLKEMYWEPSVYEGMPLVGGMHLLFLLGLLASKSRLSDDETSSLRFAAVDLDYGLRLRPGVANVYRPMLARCLMATGQRETAIAEYEKILEAEFLEAVPGVVKKIAFRTIAENLVTLGRSGRAIEILEKLAEDLPAEKGLYLRIAELQHEEGRFNDVGVSLRKEIERDPGFGEDWRISHLLMRSAAPLTADEISRQISANREVYGPLEFVLREYWPPFGSLPKHAGDKWLLETAHLGSVPRGSPLWDAQLLLTTGAYIEALESELRSRLFLPYASHVTADRQLRSLAEQGAQDHRRDGPKRFCDFLLAPRKKPLSLGEMIFVLDPATSRGKIFDGFREWQTAKFPRLALNPKDLVSLNSVRRPKAHGERARAELEDLRLCIRVLADIMQVTGQ